MERTSRGLPPGSPATLQSWKVRRLLLGRERGAVALRACEVSCASVADALRQAFAAHPAARGLRVRQPLPVRPVCPDPMLVERLLANAFEATPPGGEVAFGAWAQLDSVAFEVWNAGEIPVDAWKRVFQRHFSTKSGRGFGT